MAVSGPIGAKIGAGEGLVGWAAIGVRKFLVNSAALSPDEETFGEMVAKLRNRIPGKVSQAKLAELAHVSEKTIQNIETGASTDPATTTVRGLAEAFGVPVSTLSRKLGWVPVEESDPNWLLAGLDPEVQHLLMGIVARLRGPTDETESPQRAAES